MRRIEVFLFCYQPNSHCCCRTTPLKNKIPCYDAFTLDVKMMFRNGNLGGILGGTHC
jgi:hypothetical protein